MRWSYRPELDGLRTIAVYLVLLFHSGLSVVGGGFVGVDLFFVLSGFLVSMVLLDEHARTGSIRLWTFYARRVRRLLPAALVTVVATAGMFVLVASQVRRLPLVGDAQSALLYVSNWRFLHQQNDYFGAEIDRSPFLHFWSLSIEEQFYLALPLLLIGLLALRARRPILLPACVMALLLASLASQVWWAHRDADHAYYGTEARAYQLLAGVLAALLMRTLDQDEAETPRLGLGLLAPVGLVGLLAVASGLITMTPSLRGIAAVAASAAIIVGLSMHPGGIVASALARPTMNYLGRISYSTYLWHWPVILMLREVLDIRPIVLAALAGAVSTGLASLSYHVLEHPIRTSRALGRHAPTSVVAGLASSVVVALLIVPPILHSQAQPVIQASPTGVGDGARDRPIPQGIDWFAYANDKGPDDTYCTREDQQDCVVHQGSTGLHVALVGDSHGRMLAQAFEDLAEQHDFTLSLDIIEACPWQAKVLGRRDSGPLVDACEENRHDLYSGLIADMDIDLVVLTQLPRDRGGYLDNSGLNAHDFDVYNLNSMHDTLEAITAQGATAVMFEPMWQVPEELPNPLECLSGQKRTGPCRVPAPTEPAPSVAFVRTLALSVPGAFSVTLNDLMCPNAPICEPLDGDVPVWRDRRHYSPAAISEHEDQIWQRILETQPAGSNSTEQ